MKRKRSNIGIRTFQCKRLRKKRHLKKQAEIKARFKAKDILEQPAEYQDNLKCIARCRILEEELMKLKNLHPLSMNDVAVHKIISKWQREDAFTIQKSVVSESESELVSAQQRHNFEQREDDEKDLDYDHNPCELQ